MKKSFSLILTCIIMLSLAGCSDTNGTENTQSESISSSVQSNTEAENTEIQVQTDSSSAGISSETESSTNILVAYFSYGENADLPDGVDASTTASIQVLNNEITGNTGVFANIIAQLTEGDIFSIQTAEKYPASYDETLDKGQEEQSGNERPQIVNIPENLDDYDVLFLGYPNWWGDMPMAVYSFLDAVDLSGKTIIPFVTSGGSGFSNTISTIEEMEPEATVQEGLSSSYSSLTEAQNEINEWLSEIGYVQ